MSRLGRIMLSAALVAAVSTSSAAQAQANEIVTNDEWEWATGEWEWGDASPASDSLITSTDAPTATGREERTEWEWA